MKRDARRASAHRGTAFLPRKQHHCIVIGAGLAGLAAAFRLSRKGWKIDLLEARSTPGGRVVSHRFNGAQHLACELGGEWIGEDHRAMRRLCGYLGLELQDHSYSFFFWKSGSRQPVHAPGQWGLSRPSAGRFDAFHDEFRFYTLRQKQELDKYDWWTALRNRGFPPKDLQKRDLMDSTDFGESIRQTSAYAAATEYFESNPTNEMDFKIVGGNDRLVCALVNSLEKGSVQCGREVKAILQRQGRVIVRVARHARPFIGDACICTVPARSLNRIEWDPPLPLVQSEAADQLQYARIMKTVILYADRFWPKPLKGGFSVFTSGASDFCFDSTYLQPGKQGILCSYAIGDKADDLASETDLNLKKWITKDVAEATANAPVSETTIERYLLRAEIARASWEQNDPYNYAQGAYAFYRPGQWFTIRPVLEQPHGRVLFAGEHLADWQGFMEGAVNTGEAVADALC